MKVKVAHCLLFSETHIVVVGQAAALAVMTVVNLSMKSRGLQILPAAAMCAMLYTESRDLIPSKWGTFLGKLSYFQHLWITILCFGFLASLYSDIHCTFTANWTRESKGLHWYQLMLYYPLFSCISVFCVFHICWCAVQGRAGYTAQLRKWVWDSI